MGGCGSKTHGKKGEGGFHSPVNSLLPLASGATTIGKPGSATFVTVLLTMALLHDMPGRVAPW